MTYLSKLELLLVRPRTTLLRTLIVTRPEISLVVQSKFHNFVKKNVKNFFKSRTLRATQGTVKLNLSGTAREPFIRETAYLADGATEGTGEVLKQ